MNKEHQAETGERIPARGMTGTQAACVESLIQNGISRIVADCSLIKNGYRPTLLPSVLQSAEDARAELGGTEVRNELRL